MTEQKIVRLTVSKEGILLHFLPSWVYKQLKEVKILYYPNKHDNTVMINMDKTDEILKMFPYIEIWIAEPHILAGKRVANPDISDDDIPF